MKILDLSADQIINEPNPFRLLDVKNLKSSFRDMSMRWHPDKPGGNGDVFAKLNVAKSQIEDLMNGRINEIDHVRMFTGADGSRDRMVFQAKLKTDTGAMYVGYNTVAFAERRELSNLFNARIPEFKFVNDKMRDSVGFSLPLDKTTIEEKDEIVYVIKKSRELVPLGILLDFARKHGGLEPVHAAWIVSRMLNIVCYLSRFDIVHTAINPTNLFVDTKTHGVALLGGWRLATHVGDTMKAVPAFTRMVAPRRALESKIADVSIDLAAFKAVARIVFGDIAGRKLHVKTPSEVKRWLRLPPEKVAVDEYAAWEKAREGFGPRKFVAWSLGTAGLYDTMRASKP